MERSETFYPGLCKILISFVLVLSSDKRSFSIFVEDKKLFVRRTADLTLVSLGGKENKNFNLGETPEQNENKNLFLFTSPIKYLVIFLQFIGYP